MQFSEEEIRLCQEIGRHHKKPIKYGDWIEYKNRIYFVLDYDDSENIVDLATSPKEWHTKDVAINRDYIISLWTWQDAREWLKKKGWLMNGLWDERDHISINIVEPQIIRGIADFTTGDRMNQHGKTDLEVILKAVLEIMKRRR